MTIETVPSTTPVTEPTQEAVTLHGQFRALDATQQGVGLDKIRPFYPRVGWGVILSRVAELEAVGMVTKRAVMNSNGTVGYHLYTWKDA